MATDSRTPYEPPLVRDLQTLVEITGTATGNKNETSIPGLDPVLTRPSADPRNLAD